MGFGEAIKVCFSKYADFSGRARRSEYWWFQLFLFLVQLPVQIVFWVLYFAAFVPVLAQADANGTIPESAFEDLNWGPIVVGIVLAVIVGLALFLPTLAVTVRRLHDTGRSGWWVLLSVIPIVNYVGGIVVLVFTFLDSEQAENAYGPNPKGGQWGYIPMTPPPAYGYPAQPAPGAPPAYPAQPTQPENPTTPGNPPQS